MKIAVVVGHNSRGQGANTPAPISKSEFKFNNLITQKMIQLSQGTSLEVIKINRKHTGSYSSEIDNAYAEVNASGADASIELHFNAAGPTATGTETLTSGFPGSTRLGQSIQTAMLAALGLRDRGLKSKTRGERGGRSLHVGRPPAVLVEPFFASNSGDVKAAHKLGITGFAQMYLDGLTAFFGLPALDRDEVEDTDTFLADADIKVQGLDKPAFFAENKTALKAIIKAINRGMEADAHGEPINALSLTEAVAVMNAEIGLNQSGNVNGNATHSNGERGLLPLPSNLEFWNGAQSRAANATNTERNVKEFLLYLANIKNKDIGRSFDGGALYRDLFSLTNDITASTHLLAAVVHGWFYLGNYTPGLPSGLLSAEIIRRKNTPEKLITTLSELGYKHAVERPQLLENRFDNLKDGLTIGESL